MKKTWRQKPAREANQLFLVKSDFVCFVRQAKIQLKINALLSNSDFHSAVWNLKTRNIVPRSELLNLDIFLRQKQGQIILA